MNTADVLADGLARAGTPRVFASDDADSVMVETVERRGLALLRVSGPAAACVMAGVTGTLTSAPGVAVVGAADAGAGVEEALAQARHDCAPVIVVSSYRFRAPAPPTSRAAAASPGARDSLSLDAAVKARLVIEPDSAAHSIAHAAQLAMKDPRGLVWLDLAPEVARSAALPVATSCRPAPLPPPDTRALDEAARRLAAAVRPLLVAGLQCRAGDTSAWLRALAEALPAPVRVTPGAKGAVPDPHPLCLGVFTGDVVGDPLVARADLVVTIGVEATELRAASWPLTVPVLHLARSPHSGAAWRPELEVIGEIATILEELAPRLRRRAADWDVAELDRLKRAAAARLVPSVIHSDGGLSARRTVEITRAVSPAGTIAAVDGRHAALAAACWPAVAPGEFLVASGAPELPFALGAASAARLARPERRVVAFVAAGTLRAAAAELMTTAELALPITVIALDEASRPEAAGDVVALGRGAGLAVSVATSESDARQALVQALSSPSPSLVIARIGPGR